MNLRSLRPAVMATMLPAALISLADLGPSQPATAAAYTELAPPFDAGHVAVWTDAGGARLWSCRPTGGGFGRAIELDERLHLRFATFDPLLGEPSVMAALRAPDASRTFIVQFVVPPIEPLQALVRAYGGETYTTLPSNALAAKLPPAAVEALRGSALVRWIGPYHAAYKLDESILAQLAAGAAGAPARCSIECFARGPAQQSAVANRIASLGGQVHFISPDGFRMEATLTLAQVVEVARLDEVHFIDPWGPPGADMDIVRQLSGAVPLLSSAGFTGQGVRGEIFDTEVQSNHPEWNGQPPLIHGTNGSSGSHGTASYGINFATGAVNEQATGMCPDREQGIFAWYTQVTQFGGRKTRMELNQEAVDPSGPYRSCYQSAAVGSPQTTNYTTVSAEVDDYLFQVDYLSFQDMSNSGNVNCRPQAWAKNIVSTTGIFHKETLTRADDSMSSGGYGPAKDGRIKPDLVHCYDSVFTTWPVSSYTNFAGGSAAVAITAGCGGLTLQMWHAGVWKHHGGGASVFASRPASATAKALLINSAYRYPLTQGGLIRVKQGWGMPDLAVMYESRDRTYVCNEQHLLAQGGVNAYIFEVPEGSPELAVTMVYKDPKGVPGAAVHRINDLSLRVTAPDGVSYWGNYGLDVSNVSSPGGAANKIDTVENVFLADPTPGVWKVEVLGDEIVQDGNLNTPQVDAAYALVFRGKSTKAVGCPGDVTLDGAIDQMDLGVLLAAFGSSLGQPQYSALADFNADAAINQADLSVLLARYGVSCQ